MSIEGSTTPVRFIEHDGTVTDIRFKTKRAARLAARLNNDPMLHYRGWQPKFRAVFVLDEPKRP